jgi:perosamine synthetase
MSSTPAPVAHTRPCFDEQEAQAVLAVLTAGVVCEAGLARKLVAAVAQRTGSLGGVPTSTCALGLHLALKTLGVESQADEVIIPDYVCPSVCDSVLLAGGAPVLCDINLDDYNLAVNAVRSQLRPNTRAIVLPHMYGCPADLDSFLALGVPVIEDCAHALGATYNGRPVGAYGRLAAYSFEGSKLVAAGEGGVVLANEAGLLETLTDWRYGNAGRVAHPYCLSDLLAAVALVQLDKLPAMIERRRTIANFYREELADLAAAGVLRLPRVWGDRESVWYRFVMVCAVEAGPLIRFANQQGVLIRPPLPSGVLSEMYSTRHLCDNRNSRTLVRQGVSLPVYPDLQDSDMARVVEVVRAFYRSPHVVKSGTNRSFEDER